MTKFKIGDYLIRKDMNLSNNEDTPKKYAYVSNIETHNTSYKKRYIYIESDYELSTEDILNFHTCSWYQGEINRLYKLDLKRILTKL